MPNDAAMIESLNREELYEQVWLQPMNKLGKTYGISGAEVSKVCRRLSVPTPAPGHWRKLELGIPVERLPLLPVEIIEEAPPRQEPVEQQPEPSKPPKPKKELTETEQKVLEERKEENRITVADQFTSPHPLAEKTQLAFAKAKPADDGRVVPKGKGSLDVCVAPASIDRALRIMDALVKALASRGYLVSIDRKEDKTWVTVDGEKISFSLAEQTDRREKELTPAEKRELKEDEKHFWFWHRKEYVRFPNATFTLAIDNYGGSLRRRWTDCATQRLEDRLNLFTSSIIRIAEDMKRSRLEAKERARIWEEQAPERERRQKEEQQRRLEEERRSRYEQWRIDGLKSKLPGWLQAEQMRAFVAAVRVEEIRRHGEIQEGSETAQWLAWAEQVANQNDPLAEGGALPTYSPDEETRRRLEPFAGWGGSSTGYAWSPPNRPR